MMVTRLGKLLVTLGVDSSEFDKGISSASKSFMGLNKSMLVGVGAFAGATAGAVALGKELYELGGQGAAVAQTRQSFDLLLNKLNLAPDLLQQLRDGARGTVDDMTLMSSTATLLAGTSETLGKELGDATPKLLEIAKAANKLNPSLGDTAFLYESIATGVKRASPMILDNLGLTIKIGAANEKLAQQLGKTVDELTAEEKQLALLNETMRAGNRLIEQAGGNVDSQTDAFARNEAAMKNMKDEWAVFVSGPMTDVAEGVGGLLEGFNSAAMATTNLQAAFDAGKITWEEHVELQSRLNDGSIDAARVAEELANAQYNLEVSMGITNDTSDEQRDIILGLYEKYGLLYAQAYDVKDAEDDLAGSVGGANTALDTQVGITENLKGAMARFNEQLVFQKLAANMSEEASLKLGIALGVIDTKTLILDASIGGLIEKFDTNEDGVISANEATSEYIETILGLTTAIQNAPSQKDIKVNVTTYYKQVGNPSGYEFTPKIPGKGEKPIAFSTGGQFIVPPGYPNDTFPLLVTSGELVAILTPEQRRSAEQSNWAFDDTGFVPKTGAPKTKPPLGGDKSREYPAWSEAKRADFINSVRRGQFYYGDPIYHEDKSVERPGDPYYDMKARDFGAYDPWGNPYNRDTNPIVTNNNHYSIFNRRDIIYASSPATIAYVMSQARNDADDEVRSYL